MAVFNRSTTIMTDTNPILAAFSESAETPAPVEASVDTTSQTAPSSDTTAQPAESTGGQDKHPFDFFLDQTKPQTTEAKEAKPADAAVEPADDFTESIQGTPEAQAKWGELRRELKEAKARIAQAEAAQQDATPSQQAQAAAALEKRVKEYEAQIQNYEKELSISRVEATREYKAMVEEPLNAIVASAEKIATVYNVDADSLINALTETDAKRQTQMLEEIVEGMSERDRARIYRMADDTASIYETDASIRARASDALAEVDAKQQAEAKYISEQRAAENFEAASKVWSMVTERLPDIGVDYASLKNDVVSSDFDSATPEARGYAASASIVLPHLVKAIAAKDARISELEKALGGLRKAAPTSQAGNAAAAPSSKSTNPIAGMLFGD